VSLGALLAVVKYVVGVREEIINFYHLVPSIGDVGRCTEF